MADMTFKPVFEETESAIKERLVGNIAEKWRAQPGDFMHDAVVPAAPEVQQLKVNQDYILKNSFTLLAEGEYLDLKVAEADVERFDATQAKGVLQITASQGTVLPQGHTVTTVILDQDQNPITATLDAQVTYTVSGPLNVAVTTTGVGAIMNVPAGSEWVLTPPIPGVQQIAQAADFAYGTDTEKDDSVKNRWKEQRRKNRRSGNKQDYVAWALEVDGVGMAKCLPLWAGKGTVKVIIANTNKQPASPELVHATQLYIDPDQTGEGNGKAPVGAIVTVESAVNLAINVVATLVLLPGHTLADATTAFRATLATYLGSMAFTDGAVVVYTKVASLLGANSYIQDYSGLTVNGGTSNIAVASNEIPTVGTTALT